MGFKLNPITGQFDLVGSGGGGGAVSSVNGQTGVVTLDAVDIPYDNTTSGLAATDVQDAIDEIRATIASGDTEAIYVDASTGNDTTGTGSILYPVATLNKAVTLVTNPVLNYIIRLGPGTYTGATVNWPPNCDLQGSGNSSIVQNTVNYTATAASNTGFNMSMVSMDDVVLDFTLAASAIPTFYNGTFDITRTDTLGIGPWAVLINDSTLGDCDFSGNNLLSNSLFVSNCVIRTAGSLVCSDCTIGIQLELEGNAQLKVTGCTIPGILNGTTIGPDTPVVTTDAGSLTGTTLINVDVVLADQADRVEYDNTTSGLTAINVQDAIDEIAGTAGANTALSNLASVDINTDLLVDADNTHALGDVGGNSWAQISGHLIDSRIVNSYSTDGTIIIGQVGSENLVNTLDAEFAVLHVNDSPTVATYGVGLGTSDKTGSDNSRSTIIRSGSVEDGTSGQLDISSGPSTNAGSTTGNITFSSGEAGGNGSTSGTVNISSGNAEQGTSGNVNISSGQADGGGSVSGDISVSTGPADTGKSGDILVTTGDSLNDAGGNITIRPSQGSATTQGSLQLTSKSIFLDDGINSIAQIFSKPFTSITPDAFLGTGGTAAVINGNGFAGRIEIQAGTGSGTGGGILATVAFDAEFANNSGSASVLLFPQNDLAAGLSSQGLYANGSNGGFSITTLGDLTDSEFYVFSYIVIGVN